MTPSKLSYASYKNSDPDNRPFYRRSSFWKVCFALLLIIFIVHYCSSSHKPTKSKSQAVVLAIAHRGDVPVFLSGLGTVTPENSVTVRTQINGQLMQVFFREGQMVKVGDVLAQIDPRPYEALLLQYEGQLARDTALLANAKLDLKRYEKLWKENSISKQMYDTQASLVKQNEGSVRIDEGLIASTKLNLTYTRITSPVNGRIGLSLVNPGNYVQTSDTAGIAVINTLNPMDVISTIPEDEIPQVMEQLDANKVLSVIAYDRTQTKILATGKLITVDNQIDPTTGTVKLRSQFQNEKNQLFPNQFVNINLLVTTLKDATLVPTAAIQHGSQGAFIYVVLKNTDEHLQKHHKKKSTEHTEMTVKMTPVEVGIAFNDETVITKGIAPGDSVVIEGADKLKDAASVHIAGTKTTEQKSAHKHRRHFA